MYYQNNQNFNFSFPNLDLNIPVTIKIEVAARSLFPSTFALKSNNTNLSTITVPNIISTHASEYAKIISKTINYNSNVSNFTLELEYSSSDNGSMSWLNYIELNARRKLIMSGNSMLFRDVTNILPEVGRFEIEHTSAVTVWDISDPTNISTLPTTINGSLLSFNDSINVIHEYIVFNSSAYLTPALRGSIPNQNLHNISSDIEYVIVSHPNFLNAANRLANFHTTQDNLESVIVTT